VLLQQPKVISVKVWL